MLEACFSSLKFMLDAFQLFEMDAGPLLAAFPRNGWRAPVPTWDMTAVGKLRRSVGFCLLPASFGRLVVGRGIGSENLVFSRAIYRFVSSRVNFGQVGDSCA